MRTEENGLRSSTESLVAYTFKPTPNRGVVCRLGNVGVHSQPTVERSLRVDDHRRVGRVRVARTVARIGGAELTVLVEDARPSVRATERAVRIEHRIGVVF